MHLIALSLKQFLCPEDVQNAQLQQENIKNFDSLEKALVCHDDPGGDEKKNILVEKLLATVGLLKSKHFTDEDILGMTKRADYLLDTASKKRRLLADVTNYELIIMNQQTRK